LTDFQAFWSYVHADDEADGGRIRRLAHDVIGQYAMLTGEQIGLFLDADAIKWGDEWRAKIDAGLSSVAFFVAVLSPRYLLSPECRRELQAFASRATALGIKELVLPLLYVDIPDLTDAASDDDLVVLIRSYQWEDWRELRFDETASSSYRKGVANLAVRLAEANRKAEQAATLTSVVVSVDDASDDAPGLIDRLADGEQALPKWTETVEVITENIQLVGSAMRASVEEIQRSDAQNKGFAGRVMAARVLAARLKKPIDAISSASQDFVTQLNKVDEVTRTLIDLSATQLKEQPAQKERICEFFGSVRKMAAAADGGLGEVKAMVDMIGPLESMSRDLRPIMRRLRQGLTLLLEGRTIINEWVNMVDASGVECPPIS
jgi:hypothetical protein